MNGVALHAGVITIHEEQLLEKYSADIDKEKYPDNMLGNVKKFRDFWSRQDGQKKQEIILDISSLFIKNLALPIVRGSVAGSIMGCATGAVIASVPGMIPGATLGAKIGAVFGGIVGIQLLCKDIKIVVLKSSVYEDWTTTLKAQDVYNIYTKIVQEDGSFDEYICSITGDFPSIPVRSPHGHLYDKQAIEQWIDQRETQIALAIQSGSRPEYIEGLKRSVCPRRNGAFSKNDLTYEETFFVRLNAVIKDKLLQNENFQSDSLFKEGLDKLSCANQQNRISIISSQIGSMYVFCEMNNLPSRIAEVAKDKILEQYRAGKI